jgi:hypothetical protein
MADGGERWLRPNARTLLRIFARGVGYIWLLLAIACAVVWWHHGILDNKVALLFVQMAAGGVLLATLFAIDWAIVTSRFSRIRLRLLCPLLVKG